MTGKSSRVNGADKKRAGKKSGAPGAATGDQLIARVRGLAWAGQHRQAIDLATQGLSTLAAETVRRSVSITSAIMDLLDLRAESYIAGGKLDLAAKDAAAMIKLANAEKKPALKIQSQRRKAVVQMRRGDLEAALKTAATAVKLARSTQSADASYVLASSLLVLSEAQWRTQTNEAAIASSREAIALFQASEEPSGTGRALWSLANAYANVALLEDSRRAAEKALEVCQRSRRPARHWKCSDCPLPLRCRSG